MKALLLILLLVVQKAYNQEGSKVNEQFLKAVVNIKVDSFAGTGFIIGVENERGIQEFLVTNKHMIGHWTMIDSFIPAKEIYVTLYTINKATPFSRIKIPISDSEKNLNKNVIVHPNNSVDVACIHLNEYVKDMGPPGYAVLDTNFLIPLESIKKSTFIGLGSQVFTVGYPANLKIAKSNEPIVKTGYIASSFTGDLAMVDKWKNKYEVDVFVTNKSKYFLVDGLIIPGNSGGPVITPIISHFYDNGIMIHLKPPIENRIIGIVSYSKPGTGICTIFPSDYILELIRLQISKIR